MDGSFRNVRQCKAIVMADEWQVDQMGKLASHLPVPT